VIQIVVGRSNLVRVQGTRHLVEDGDMLVRVCTSYGVQVCMLHSTAI
jgi:hypothetical protein